MFYEGQKVVALDNAFGQFTKGVTYTVRYVDGKDTFIEKDDSGSTTNGWASRLFVAAPSAPSVAADLRLKPQSKTILRHLKNHGRISPAKASVVYGITRLAACIFDIRKVGYEVTTKMREDEQGHKYAQYLMAKVN